MRFDNHADRPFDNRYAINTIKRCLMDMDVGVSAASLVLTHSYPFIGYIILFFILFGRIACCQKICLCSVVTLPT